MGMNTDVQSRYEDSDGISLAVEKTINSLYPHHDSAGATVAFRKDGYPISDSPSYTKAL